MALIKCEECGKDISDQALICPHCGDPKVAIQESPTEAKKEPKSVGVWTTGFLIVVVLVVVIKIFGNDDVPNGEPKAEKEPAVWRIVGNQGDMQFVVIPKEKVDTSETYWLTINSICKLGEYCNLSFWEEGVASPSKFPLTDDEVSTQLAHYVYNPHNGHKKMIWRCGLVPEAAPDNCFND